MSRKTVNHRRDLISALLTYPNQKTKLLDANKNLLDQNFVQLIELVSGNMANAGNHEAAYFLQKLINRINKNPLIHSDESIGQQHKNRSHNIVAGLLLTSGLALLATSFHKIPALEHFSPLILAVLLGMLVRNTIGLPRIFQPGIKFSLKRILRLGIILLGLRLSLSQVIEVGPMGLGIVAVTLISTFVFTCWLGRKMGINDGLTKLIAAGSSICGASAVVATNAVVDSEDEDVAYAVTIVTIFGTLSMFLYPLLSPLFSLTPEAFGIWCGASIHEVAGVVAAAFQGGEISGELGTISKLSRVLFLAPMMLTLGLLSINSSRGGQQMKLSNLPIPWFVFGFMALIIFNSLNILPTELKEMVIQGNKFLLTISLAAMGLETSIAKMLKTGLKPLYLGAASWIFVSVMGLGLAIVFY